MPNRALLHDVRGILGAASSNIEFLRGQSDDPVLEEVAHEIRLVADVIALTGAIDDTRPLEVDLRAVFFTERGGRSFTVDATHPPFVLRAHRDALTSFASDVLAASSRGAGIEVTARACTVYGLAPAAAVRLCSAAVLAEAALDAAAEGGALILRRKD